MLLRFLAALLAALALPAFATPQPRDATDMWFNPSESGWGLNVIHQGDTLFATLFVYGQDGQPRWYVASSLTGGPSAWSGTLYEQTGPAFSVASFDPNAVTRRAVGAMTLSVGDNGGTLDYTVDGVHVTKAVTRFSFRATSITGTYIGSIYQPGAQPNARISLTINDDDGANVTMSSGDSNGTCTWNGTHRQNGQYTVVNGTYTCGSRPGTWSMTADPATDGITASMVVDGVEERMAGARTFFPAMRGNGFRNEMWFVPSESGWGFNTIEQGNMGQNTLFATLFVYDAQGRPKWYVAPALERQDLADDTMYHAGVIYEMTGPYFGGAFNAGAVTRRAAGSVSLITRNSGTGRLSYSIDGKPVDKEITRFTFRKNDFSGSYSGEVLNTASNGTATYDAVVIVIDDRGPFEMTTGTGSESCTYRAPETQIGQVRVMSGTYSCNNGRSGSFTMSNATVTGNGFSALLTTAGVYLGHIAGVRLGN